LDGSYPAKSGTAADRHDVGDVGVIAGVCFIRDARDMLPFLCGHYLRVGFDHLRFVDDGSTDGTFEFLTSLANKSNRVSVERVLSNVDDQPGRMTNAANAMIAAGHRIIVPFDSDELWNVTAARLRKAFSAGSDLALLGRWQNFVQMRSQRSSSATGLLRMRYRAPDAGADMMSVSGCRLPFVCYVERKIAFATAAPVQIIRGQHELIVGPPLQDGAKFEIFHLPLRCRDEIIKRGINYEPRRALLRTNPEESWQSAFHAEVVNADRVNAVWAANSADSEGRLDVYGKPMTLIPDTRLCHALARAWLYMAVRWPTLVLSR
jgi:hypothetical protein